MTKINDDLRRQITAIEKEYETLQAQTKKLEDKDWFLVEVKFTPESLAAYQSALKAYPDTLAAWKAEQATKPDSEKTFLDILEPMPPFSPSAYGMSDFFNESRNRRHDSYHIESSADGLSEKWAIRANQFDLLDKKPHILSITVTDQGKPVATLVGESMARHQAERLAELAATRPSIRGASGDKPAPP